MAGEVVLRKRLRLTPDFEVTVEGLTEGSLREHDRLGRDYEEPVGDPAMWTNLLRHTPVKEI